MAFHIEYYTESNSGRDGLTVNIQTNATGNHRINVKMSLVSSGYCKQNHCEKVMTEK